VYDGYYGLINCSSILILLADNRVSSHLVIAMIPI